MRFILHTCLLSASLGLAQTTFLPLDQVRTGMKGRGLTVFSGEKVEAFDVEILGILENAGPKQSIILAKLSGGPLAHTGVLQGMSGSPVYVNNRLIGAVALAFSLSKDPIAGIRPIEEMLAPQAVDRRPALARAAACTGLGLLSQTTCADPQIQASLFPSPNAFGWGESKLEPIATPVSFSGFTQSALQAFGGQLRQFGLEPRQGMSGGSGANLPAGNPANLKPGSMISVMLVSGDMTMGADGTVTSVEGKRVYAFGHRFLSMGDVEMPFGGAEVLTLLPNLSTSFKISTARNILGTITNDYSTAVQGELGRKADVIPVTITVRNGKRLSKYAMQIVRDAALTPFLLQMTSFSALEATERTTGLSSFTVKQRIAFASGAAVTSSNIFSGEFNIPMIAAQSGAIPVAYAMQSGFADLRIRRIDLDFESHPEKRVVQIEEISTSRRSARPGETVAIQVGFASEGKRFQKQISYRIPAGAQTGTLNLTVSDAMVTNMLEFRQTVLLPGRSPAAVLRLMRGLKENTSAYLRVWRAEQAYQAQGEDIPAPPPSVANLLARSQGGSAATSYTSKIAQLEIPLEGVSVSGSKSTTIEVKE